MVTLGTSDELTPAPGHVDQEQIGHFINGLYLGGAERFLDACNPTTGRVVRQVAATDPKAIEQAIANAEAAFPAWRDTPPLKRARIMFRFKNLLEQHTDHIAALITEEHGKILSNAAGEFQRGVEDEKSA